MDLSTRSALLLALCLLAAACSSTRPRLGQAEGSLQLARAPVLLMPVDVELSALLASGLSEPRADWTDSTRALLQSGLSEQLRKAGARPLVLSETTVIPAVRQVELLYQAVASSILSAELQPESLPTKRGRFDWTLGPGAAGRLRDQAPRLEDGSPPRYALFCYVRDSYASSGRKALMVVGPLLGLGVQGGKQIGVASLVDLRDGRVVWFNLLIAQSGDLREAEAAELVTSRLLEGLL